MLKARHGGAPCCKISYTKTSQGYSSLSRPQIRKNGAGSFPPAFILMHTQLKATGCFKGKDCRPDKTVSCSKPFSVQAVKPALWLPVYSKASSFEATIARWHEGLEFVMEHSKIPFLTPSDRTRRTEKDVLI